MTPAAFSLEGKVALVTGASRGLGLEIAKALAGAEALVLLNGRNAEHLAHPVAAIVEAGGRAVPLAFDVADPTSVERAFAQIKETWGRLDILVNNVGQRDRRGLFEFALEDVRRLIEADLIAPFNVSRHAARLMMEHGEGRIVNISSISGSIAIRGDAAYIAAKGGLEAMTRAFAAELGPSGITVNTVAPGFFATETNAAMVANPEIAAMLKRRTSLGRWGQPHEIAGAVLFFVSPAASYVTGQMLAVDGGFLAHF